MCMKQTLVRSLMKAAQLKPRVETIPLRRGVICHRRERGKEKGGKKREVLIKYLLERELD